MAEKLRRAKAAGKLGGEEEAALAAMSEDAANDSVMQAL